MTRGVSNTVWYLYQRNPDLDIFELNIEIWEPEFCRDPAYKFRKIAGKSIHLEKKKKKNQNKFYPL